MATILNKLNWANMELLNLANITNKSNYSANLEVSRHEA